MERFQDVLPDLQGRWRRLVGKHPLPWYAEEKLKDGAFSSLLGLTVAGDLGESASQGRWEAMAIGDSCLFHVRGGRLLDSFPLERQEQFDSRPLLVSSEPSRNGRLDKALVEKSGFWEAGDVFYLMTDALACWFLSRSRNSAESLPDLEGLEDDDAFRTLVDDLRATVAEDGRRLLKNDDVTLVRCRLARPG